MPIKVEEKKKKNIKCFSSLIKKCNFDAKRRERRKLFIDWTAWKTLNSISVG